MTRKSIKAIKRAYTPCDSEDSDYDSEESECDMIDDPDNIANQAIYIWSGGQDDVVAPKGQQALRKLYKHFGVSEKLTYRRCSGCDHGWEDDNSQDEN